MFTYATVSLIANSYKIYFSPVAIQVRYFSLNF